MRDLGRFLRAEWDRLAGYGCVAAGVVLLGVGSVGVRTSADVIDEISYLVTGGIGSIFLLGVGATLLLSADIHDDFRKLHRVEQKLDRVERLLLAEHPDLIDPANRGQVQPPNASDRVDPGHPAGADPASSATARVPVAAVRRGRLFAVIGIVVAGVLFLAGALRTANEASTDHLAGPVGVALVGALLAAFVATVMVAQLRSSMEQRKAVVLGNWLTAVPDAGDPEGSDAGTSVGPLFMVGGLPLYHRTGCQLLAGRPASEVDRTALPPGASPCRLCEPS